MTIANIRNALETALTAISAGIDEAHQNTGYVPVVDRPYQEVYVLRARPDNSTLGSSYYKEQGIFQISLKYPVEVGAAESELRAQVIRDAFRRGSTFSYGGQVVQIDETPEIGEGAPDGDRWKVVIRIRWHADAFS